MGWQTSLLLGFAVLAPVTSASAQSTPLGASPEPSGDATQVSAAPADPPSSQGETGLADIVVTAQRRSENLQRAAISVTAVTGAELVERGVTSPTQLTQLAPALQITQLGGPYTSYTLRGVTSAGANAFADPAIAVNFNQVYLATPTAAFGLYYDLERIEVLKGPQGTLYGRNATGGAINIIPRRPQIGVTSAEIGMEAGNYDLLLGRAAVNLPVGGDVAIRIASQALTRGGYFSDDTGDENGEAIRASIFARSGNLSVLAVADYAHSNDSGGGATVVKRCADGVGACFFGDPFQSLQDQPAAFAPLAPQSRNTFNNSEYYGVAATIELETEIGTLTIIPAYRQSKVRLVSNIPGFYFREYDDPRQTTVEARFTSKSQGPFSWLVGGYYLDATIKGIGNTESAAGRSFSANYYDQSTKSWAGFGQLGYEIANGLRLTGSARYSHERKRSDSVRYTLRNLIGPDPVLPLEMPNIPPSFAVDAERSWDSANYRVGAEWDVGPASLLYANVGTGFKAGGFYFGVPGANSYEPEEVVAYTIGSKNRFFDNRLQLNAEAFWLDYNDQQLSYIKVLGGSAIQVTENIGQARIKGGEVEALFRPTPDTLLSFQGQYTDARYKSLVYTTVAPPPQGTACAVAPTTGGFSVNCSGRDVLRAPKWVLSGSIEQSFTLPSDARIVAFANIRYESARELDLSYIPESRVGDNKRIDASLSYRPDGDRFSVTAFVNNLTDDAVIAAETVNPAYAVTRVVTATLRPPRTYGVRLGTRF